MRAYRHRGRNHNHSRCSREPSRALPRVAQGQDRDLLQVQRPSRHRDPHDASRPRRHASRLHRHATHHHVLRHDGQRMREQPNMPVSLPPSELQNVWSSLSSQFGVEMRTARPTSQFPRFFEPGPTAGRDPMSRRRDWANFPVPHWTSENAPGQAREAGHRSRKPGLGSAIQRLGEIVGANETFMEVPRNARYDGISGKRGTKKRGRYA